VDENLWNIVLARTAQVIESMTSLGKLDISDHDHKMRKKNMNNKKNIDGWIEYVCMNWLNRKSQSHFRPPQKDLSLR